MHDNVTTIKRHKTAMKRAALSKPVACAMEDELVSKETSFFDFGCGHGTDLEFLKLNGVESRGWDPHFRPDTDKVPSDVVNLGYVLNVIESPIERLQVLQEAFKLARKLLVVSVRVDKDAICDEKHEDGHLTKRGTFQKIYTNSEFREIVEDVLDEKAHLVEPGIFYVFKDPDLRDTFVSTKFLRRRMTRDSQITRRLTDTIDVAGLARIVEDLGRIPFPEEFPEAASLLQGGRSRERILDLILPELDEEKFVLARERMREDYLTALAVTRIESRKYVQLNSFPLSAQRDIKELWDSYSQACDEATELLFSLGKPDEVRKMIRASDVGKLLPEDLYVHWSALDYVPPICKVMLSLGQSLVGRVECDLVKFSLHGRSMSFLYYRDFDKNPHPSLYGSVRVDFKRAKYQIRDYGKSTNPPILHRKETFVHSSYDGYSKFKKLTKQEEKAGLLSQNNIGFLEQWNTILEANKLRLSGHQLRKQ